MEQMLKRTGCFLLLVMCMVLVSCSSNSKEDANAGNKNNRSLMDYKNMLIEKGYAEESDYTEKSADMIKAKDGFGLINCGIEVYEYEEGSPELEAPEKSMATAIGLKFGGRSGNFIIYTSDENAINDFLEY